MISKTIIEQRKFLILSSDAQALYFFLIANADDDGVVEGYKVLRLTGKSDAVLDELVESNFIKVLNSDQVVYICDWAEQNRVRKSRKINSVYKDILLKVVPDAYISEGRDRKNENKRCQNVQPVGRQKVSSVTTKQSQKVSNGRHSIVEDSIVKDNKEKDNLEQGNQVKFILDKEYLTTADYEELCMSFSKEIADEQINKVLNKPYHGCLNKRILSIWCEEAKQNKLAITSSGYRNKNVIHYSGERKYTDEQVNEIEKMLLKQE